MIKLQEIKDKWKNRKQYPTFMQMPTWLLILFAVLSFPVAAYYGFVISRIAPGFVIEANKIPFSQWNWQVWFIIAFLSILSLLTWFFGSICWRCNTILRERIFP